MICEMSLCFLKSLTDSEMTTELFFILGGGNTTQSISAI